MGIELRHEVLMGHIEFEFQRFNDLSKKARKARADHSLELSNARYFEYCASHKSLEFDMGALMIRESNYYLAEGTFDLSYELIHSDRLSAVRQRIDEQLIELLRSVGWSDERLEELRGVLGDRAQMEAGRREHMLEHLEYLRCRNHMAFGHMRNGRFADACLVLSDTLKELREVCKELEAKINEPATGT